MQVFSWQHLVEYTEHNVHLSNLETHRDAHTVTFFALGDALISLRAFAPRSRASGSNDGALASDSQIA